jgi:NAD(P)-dependent dehydrogenase (short-subunit alcohol dehydrogenase family)
VPGHGRGRDSIGYGASVPEQRIAFVTGASRGIGRATALALADKGFDVAVLARTAQEGTARDDSDSGQGRALPGSLESTAAEIAACGRHALPLVADLLDRASLMAAVEQVKAAFGRVDVLVNNAVHTGPGSMLPFLDTTIDQFETKVQANYLSQLVLIHAVLPGMLERGGGTVINVTSHTASNDPPGPVGQGGWGLAYAASKAALHRIAGILAVELGDRGIRAYNLDPGNVATERMAVNADDLGLGRYRAAPPSAPAAAIAWLATAGATEVPNGSTVKGLKVVLDRGLHPDWRTG